MGAGFLPLTLSFGLSGFALGGQGWWADRAVEGAVTGIGLVRLRLSAARRRRRACSSILVHSATLGQVQRDVPAAVPGGAGGDVDQVPAQCDAAGLKTSRYFGILERFWMNLQARLDLEIEEAWLGAAL